ncbi:MAG TPA: thioesterase family protein [Candidatus Limnocylindria bacterium]|nr:thioesterase family protein [Candidatus Limnocylindria bacterium]
MARGDFKVHHDLHPRFRDTDAMGHINNAVYVTYLEVARQAYWARLTGGADYRAVPFILAHVRCDFRSEALVDEVLEAGIRCEWIGTRSFAFRYEIREKSSGRMVVEATSIQVCYDYTAKATIEMPAELRRQVEAFEGRSLAREAEVKR